MPMQTEAFFAVTFTTRYIVTHRINPKDPGMTAPVQVITFEETSTFLLGRPTP